jgi:hypothetical protein
MFSPFPCRSLKHAWLATLLGVIAAAAPAGAHDAGMSDACMAHMSGHMYMTTLRPLREGDRQKAAGLVESAREAMAPYQDYRKALSDGYQIFLPDIPQPQYHFTNYEFGRDARVRFDAHKPTSLLYTKTANGGYTLVGAMYTARVDATDTTTWTIPPCRA